jgi:hypothetical protein
MRTYYNAGNAGREYSQLIVDPRWDYDEETIELVIEGERDIQLNETQCIDLARQLIGIWGLEELLAEAEVALIEGDDFARLRAIREGA